MPHSSAFGSSASLATSKCMLRLSRSTGSSIFGSRMHSSRSRRRSASIATRTISTTMCPISPICWTIVAFRGRFARDLVHLRDVHGLVADALQVQARVHDHRDQPEVGGDRRLQRQERQACRGRARGRSRRSRRRPRPRPRPPSSSCSSDGLDRVLHGVAASSPSASSRSSIASPAPRGSAGAASAEPPRDVVLGSGIARVGEDRLGLVVLDDRAGAVPGSSSTSTVKNAVRSETRAACCMLWVTITIV